ncbi:hypothetical protein FACS1894139_03280 [Planctomycetales bacterium]|nr:hypothetical protein FACS1894139_03280 [Planctomycetales bacterium]
MPNAPANCGNCDKACKTARRPLLTIPDIPPALKLKATVRYGYTGNQELFATDLADLQRGDLVVTKSPRGGDHGEVLTAPAPLAPDDQLCGYVTRRFSESDRNMLAHLAGREADEKNQCREAVAERGLPMKVVATEHLLSGEKIIFYFVADGRVDFRELVKDLARRFRTRIELKQIGVRDEARMLSDYERCGRELCCRVFLRDLEPVTMRMAKTQKATLDPNKISGHCGRLMCCLRFEDDAYQTASGGESSELKVES